MGEIEVEPGNGRSKVFVTWRAFYRGVDFSLKQVGVFPRLSMLLPSQWNLTPRAQGILFLETTK
jgi:hypothetical protein